MKKLLAILLPILVLFSACKYEPPGYALAVSINTDENTSFIKSSTFTTKVNTEFTGYYFWIPFGPKDPTIKEIISSDENIISITNIDFDNQTFTALANKTGTAYISVIANNNTYTSPLEFYVTN